MPDIKKRPKVGHTLHSVENFITSKLGVKEDLDYSDRRSTELYGEDKDKYSKTDPARHILLSAELHRKHPVLADPLLFGHELVSNKLSGEAQDEIDQDLANNRLGKLIGSVSKSRAETEWLTKKAMPGASYLKGAPPMAFENLPDILNNSLRQRELSNNFDLEAHQERMLTTGPFADALSRHKVWRQPEPIVVAGLDTSQMKTNVKEGASTGNASADAQLKALMGVDKDVVRKLTPPTEWKRGIEHTDPLRTHDEIMKRIPPARNKEVPVTTDEPLESEASIRKRLGM